MFENLTKRRPLQGNVVVAYLKLYLPAVLVIIAIGGLLQISNSVFRVPTFLIQPPSAVFLFFFGHTKLLFSNMEITMTEIVEGFALSTAIAFLVGVAMVASRIVRNAVYPLVSGLNVIPKVALVPILLIWFGLGTFPITILCALFSFFPVVLNTTNGLNSTEPELLDLGRSLKASGWQIFFKVRIPAALPQIFTGLELAINLSVIGAVIGEFIAGSKGIGYIIDAAASLNYTSEMYAALILVIVVGIGLFLVTLVAERVACRWYYLERSKG